MSDDEIPKIYFSDELSDEKVKPKVKVTVKEKNTEINELIDEQKTQVVSVKPVSFGFTIHPIHSCIMID